jgi:hypothetical protein
MLASFTARRPLDPVLYERRTSTIEIGAISASGVDFT